MSRELCLLNVTLGEICRSGEIRYTVTVRIAVACENMMPREK